MNPTDLCWSLNCLIYSHIVSKRPTTEVAVFADDTILLLYAGSSDTLETVAMRNC